MKRFESIFRTIVVLVAFVMASTIVYAENITASVNPNRMDSVDFGLVTCSPHNEIYSLYGHTALHYHDYRTGADQVFHYGVFDFHKPHFVWRFIMGQTDYRLECVKDFERWCDSYRKWGCRIEEQILNLTPEEKIRLHKALMENLLNPVYRYNFFYDNCSTRPRNIIEKCIEGTIVYAPSHETLSFRQMVHQYTKDHPWASFGNDLLLGFKADMKTTQREQEFLPANLCNDFDHATVDRQGVKKPLVLLHVTHAVPKEQPNESGFFLSPLACTLLLLCISIAMVVYEHRKKKILVWWDGLLMLVTGLAGCILTLMLFSEHPTTSTNLQVLILNPLSLIFIPAVLMRRRTRWFTINLYLTILFFIGSFLQDYAEGMEIVALCLLSRYWIHRHDK